MDEGHPSSCFQYFSIDLHMRTMVKNDSLLSYDFSLRHEIPS